jgi:hypothetical protein
MKSILAAILVAFVFVVPVLACGGMTVVEPPSLTLDDPIQDGTAGNPSEWGSGECIL